MGDKTGIEWTDATWNPIVGCSIVSPACTHCYAMAQASRIERMTPGSHYAGTTMLSKARDQRLNGGKYSESAGIPVWTGKMAQAPDHILTAPLRWKRPRRIFVNSMGDLFHENVPDEWIDRVFAVMALAPQHTFQILTKRAKRMRDYCSDPKMRGRAILQMQTMFGPGYPRAFYDDIRDFAENDGFPLDNAWLGVTAEDQTRADERIPDLLATPAALHFISAEPLLGEILLFDPTLKKLGWIIAGGESGPKARPSHPNWFRSLRDQCHAVGVPFFFKQWGEWAQPDPLRGSDYAHVETTGSAGYFKDFADAWAAMKAGECVMAKVGKRRAGSDLDGVAHKAFP